MTEVLEAMKPAAKRERPELSGWLRGARGIGDGSDLHVKVGSPPRIAAPRGLHPPRARAASRPDDTKAHRGRDRPGDRQGRFDERGEVDFAYSVPASAGSG